MVGKTALNKEMKHLNGAYFRTIKITKLFPFAMYVAFPRSDYYGNSVAMRSFQSLRS